MKPTIEVMGISKSYRMQHAASDRYPTLRDTIFRKGFEIFRRSASMTEALFWALRDVSFTVEPGDRLAVVGRNGAGKSTLLKLLSRITSPTEGRAVIRGRVSSLLEVGTGFHPELSGRENVFLNGVILGMTRHEISRRFDDIVQFAEIERFIDMPVKRYSSGMQTRLAFSVAAHLDSEILILDEVLAVGDASFQRKCLEKAGEFDSDGRTVLFVSHNMVSIKAICNKGILLEAGRLRLEADVASVLDHYTKANLRTNDTQGFSPWRTSCLEVNDVRLCDAGGERLRQIDTDTPVFVNIDYALFQEGRPGFMIMIGRDGQLLFKSVSNSDCDFTRIKKPGNYTAICEIPGMLLNAGFHNLSLTTFQGGYVDLQQRHDVLSFEVTDGLGVRRDFFGAYSGAVRPGLTWRNTERS